MGDFMVSFFNFGADIFGPVGFVIFIDFINMLLIFLVFNSIFGGNDDKKDS